MKSMYNKLTIFTIGAVSMIMNSNQDGDILLLLLLFSCTALIELSRKQIFSILFIVMFVFYPQTSAFIPLFVVVAPFWLLSLVPILLYLHPTQIFVSVLALVIRYYSFENNKLKNENIELQDLSRYNELIYEKDFERHEQELISATLHERNRIARDIHDGVGHNLSSSIIQVGALEVINENETLVEPLHDLRNTLDNAMDAIRDSVHALHHKSIDFESEIMNLIEHIPNLKVNYKHQISETPRNEIVACYLFIIKECLHNIQKHSNADQLTLTISESLESIQLLLHDNGTQTLSTNQFGMGLTNMEVRTKELHGIFNLQKENGYRIYVSVPK